MEASGRYGKWHQWCRGHKGLRKIGWHCATTRLWRIRWNLQLVGPTQRCNTIVQFHRRRCERFARLESASRTQFERQTEHRLLFLLSCHSTPSDYAQERRQDHHDPRKYFRTQKGRCMYSQFRLTMKCLHAVLRINRQMRPLAESSASESDILLKSSHHNIIILLSAHQ